MDKQIPIYFDTVVVESSFQEISESRPDIGRLKVRVFTKYGNRNGSYISDSVAEQLINSAINSRTPVVGFFDPESQTWASHTGPKIANAYGYVESFLGWEPFTDTDGITRDYAVFSVILFTEYYEEAKKILGQNQSMELDPVSITGGWTLINGEEYYAYTTAKILSFCVIGQHEPCFSVSSFFSKDDDLYKTQYEKISSLLFDLKAQVEEAENNKKGGEQPMDNLENQEANVETPQVEEKEPVENFEQDVEEQHEEDKVENTEQETDSTSEEKKEEEAEENSTPEGPTEFDILQEKFNNLQASYDELKTEYETMQSEYSEFQTKTNSELETLRADKETLQNSLKTYEAQAEEAEKARKEKLIEKYEKVLKEEEIAPIREAINNFSYDELNSKLAITYADANIVEEETKKVPLPEPQESQFALFMKKYRKN